MRDGENAHSAGNAMATGRVSGFPLQPIAPVVTPPAMNISERSASWRKGEDGLREAENAVGRNRPKIARVIGTWKSGVKEDIVHRNRAAREGCKRPALGIGRPEFRMIEGATVDADTPIDRDLLSG